MCAINKIDKIRSEVFYLRHKLLLDAIKSVDKICKILEVKNG